MSIDRSEYRNFDTLYTVRFTHEFAEEINARAELEGIKPSTWIRNSLTKYTQKKDEQNTETIKSAVMYLLISDQDIQNQILKLTKNNFDENYASVYARVTSDYLDIIARADKYNHMIKEMEEEIEVLNIKKEEIEAHLNKIKMNRELLNTVLDKSKHADKTISLLDQLQSDEAKISKELTLIEHTLTEKLLEKNMANTFLNEILRRTKVVDDEYETIIKDYETTNSNKGDKEK